MKIRTTPDLLISCVLIRCVHFKSSCAREDFPQRLERGAPRERLKPCCSDPLSTLSPGHCQELQDRVRKRAGGFAY